MAATQEDFEQKIGELIRDLRLGKNITQNQAANQFGCTLDEWKRYERGQIQDVRSFLEITISLDHTLYQMIRLLKIKFTNDLPYSNSSNNKNYVYTKIKRNMDLQEIKSYLQKEERLWVREKLQALAWLAKGMKAKRVGKRLGRTESLIRHWLWLYYKSGIGWVLKSNKRATPLYSSQLGNAEKTRVLSN